MTLQQRAYHALVATRCPQQRQHHRPAPQGPRVALAQSGRVYHYVTAQCLRARSYLHPRAYVARIFIMDALGRPLLHLHAESPLDEQGRSLRSQWKTAFGRILTSGQPYRETAVAVAHLAGLLYRGRSRFNIHTL